MNIETNGNLTKIRPLEPSFNVSQQSVDDCIKIAKFNALNKKLFNNCCNVNCPISINTLSKCISNGSYNASIMFVDAYPSEYESFTGSVTDNKGYLLNESLKNTKYNRADIYCTTLIKCSNLQGLNEGIINNCLQQYFCKEFELIRPKKVIFTSSAFNAGLKYNIIPAIGNVNYFSKVKAEIYGIETNIYIVYDINALSEQQQEAFKQGLSYILGGD